MSRILTARGKDGQWLALRQQLERSRASQSSLSDRLAAAEAQRDELKTRLGMDCGYM